MYYLNIIFFLLLSHTSVAQYFNAEVTFHFPKETKTLNLRTADFSIRKDSTFHNIESLTFKFNVDEPKLVFFKLDGILPSKIMFIHQGVYDVYISDTLNFINSPMNQWFYSKSKHIDICHKTWEDLVADYENDTTKTFGEIPYLFLRIGHAFDKVDAKLQLQNPNTFVSLFTLKFMIEAPDNNEDAAKQLYAKITDEKLKATPSYQTCQQLINALDYKHEDGDIIDSMFVYNDTLFYKELLGNHDYMFMNFWSSYCGPCIKKIPQLEAAKEKYKEQVTFIGFSLDPNYKTYQYLQLKHPVSFKNLYAKSNHPKSLKKLLRVSAIPRSVIVDKNGKIIEMNASIESLEKLLSKK